MSRLSALSVSVCVACLTTTTIAADVPESRIKVEVDPRVELMSIIFRLAGNPEYNMPNSNSPYARDVEQAFGEFRDHPVVKAAQMLRQKRGVSYDAVMSMAMHVKDAYSLKEHPSFARKPQRLDERWHKKEARVFLERARDFVEKSDFRSFVQRHETLYQKAARNLATLLNERDYIRWFDDFFGKRGATEFRAIPGLLNGGQCYGTSVVYHDGREVISPVLGVWNFDDEGVPVFDDAIVPTVVHEYCHTYTNPFVDKYEDELRKAGEKLFSDCAEQMRKQAYGTWKTMMYESLVRACVIRYLDDEDGPVAAAEQIESEKARGFVWIDELASLLEIYQQERSRYKDFDAFMPRVVKFFEDYVPQYEAQQAKSPKVVSITPTNGATDVDPNLTEIKIVFDRPMVDKSWSVCGGGPNFPEVTGKPSYDKACKVLTIPVKLKPDWSYEFSINCPAAMAFRSQDGHPVKPMPVRFKTRR